MKGHGTPALACLGGVHPRLGVTRRTRRIWEGYGCRETARDRGALQAPPGRRAASGGPSEAANVRVSMLLVPGQEVPMSPARSQAALMGGQHQRPPEAGTRAMLHRALAAGRGQEVCPVAV